MASKGPFKSPIYVPHPSIIRSWHFHRLNFRIVLSWELLVKLACYPTGSILRGILEDLPFPLFKCT
jgi:hypothetical protein